MGKNKVDPERIAQIQGLKLQQLGKALYSGEFTIKELRNAYTQMRDIAQKRIKRITNPEVVKQFGKPNLYIEDGEYFKKTKYIIGESELLKEIADVSKFLNLKASTVTGLKNTRSAIINRMQEDGFDINESNYLEFRKFMKWFKASEYAKKYDSNDARVREVWNSEKATPEDWKKAFEAYSGYEDRTAPVRQY